jgi:hypothetical protein
MTGEDDKGGTLLDEARRLDPDLDEKDFQRFLNEIDEADRTLASLPIAIDTPPGARFSPAWNDGESE